MNKILSLLTTIFFLSGGCGTDAFKNSKIKYNSHKSNEISIGVAYPVYSEGAQNSSFSKGIEFAVNTINKNGGVLNKRFNAVIRDDMDNANTAMQIAQTFSDQGIGAVVGHWSTNVSYYTQDIYEKNKVVMLTPLSTGLILFEERFDYVFRMIGNNQVFAHAIASHMAQKGHKNAAIYYSDDEFGVDFAKIMEKELNGQGIRVIDRLTNITPLNINNILNRWNAFDCDGLVMTASYPTYVESIKTLRSSGFHPPVFGGDTFEELSPQDLPHGYFDNLYIAIMNLEYLDTGFKESFRSHYNHDPNATAIIGYEAVMLLKDAMEAVKNTDGTAIAQYLSNLKDYKTVSATRTYNPKTQEFDGFNAHVLPLKPIIFHDKQTRESKTDG
ncbi:MAG: ABC transporter substrate-binding protein [Chitinispirillales bacterium]|jgi:branched-chain amino acid transport system substrate-binding protein|nr:ABC transporter substrate-binding protein [Chitinispirillales bacterium]